MRENNNHSDYESFDDGGDTPHQYLNDNYCEDNYFNNDDDTSHSMFTEESEMRRIEQEIIMNADIICCTCVCAGDRRLKKISFDLLLIDEATQLCEPACIIPLIKGIKQMTLIGDDAQLGPLVLSQNADALKTVSSFPFFMKCNFTINLRGGRTFLTEYKLYINCFIMIY